MGLVGFNDALDFRQQPTMTKRDEGTNNGDGKGSMHAARKAGLSRLSQAVLGEGLRVCIGGVGILGFRRSHSDNPGEAYDGVYG